MDRAVITFNTNAAKINKNQREVLNLLVEAGKLIADIYNLQENINQPGANFYPRGVSKSEIREAANVDPEILSPYTVVEKKSGKLVAIPYHIKYAQLLKPIADKLLKAATITENKDFARNLKIQAKALLDGSYDESTISWMAAKPYILDLVIGPIERYDDRLFFTKTSYQAWVGIMDEATTKRVFKYKDVILSARRKVLMSSEKVDYYDKVQVRVDDVVLFSGLIARTQFVGVNLPNDPVLMEKHGSEVTIFKQVNKLRFDTEVFPTYNEIFSSDFKKQFSAEELEVGSLYLVVLHELAHTYIRYRNSEKNLDDLFPIIDELAAYVMGIKVCGSLLLKEILTDRQLESIIIAFLARSYSLILSRGEKGSKMHYTIGGAIFINYLLESGALKESGGIHWPNFSKIFYSLDELSSILERMLYQGTRADAEDFINRYGNIKKLQKISKLPFVLKI